MERNQRFKIFIKQTKLIQPNIFVASIKDICFDTKFWIFGLIPLKRIHETNFLAKKSHFSPIFLFEFEVHKNLLNVNPWK